jgi:methylaspartate ammonia-lyase
MIEDKIVKSIEGYAIPNFKDMRELIEEITEDTSLHPSILFGLTQAFLAAVAKKKRLTMTEVICEEYKLSLPITRVPIHVQTGDNRYLGVDKAIIKKADAFPQGLINTIDKIGENGETLVRYAKWIVKRIRDFGEPGFDPYIHFDTYGMIGRIFNQDLLKVTKYILKLEKIIKPYRLQLEMPIDSENKQKQIESFKKLNQLLKDEGSKVILIADEWANKLDDIKDWANSKAADMIHIKPTDVGSLYDIIDSVIYCKEKNVHAYLGGSCNETDRAAQITAQLALALRPFQISAKPGMDIDEGIMTVYNEMERTLKLINYRRQMSY